MKIKLYDHLNLRIQSKVCFAMTADNIWMWTGFLDYQLT
jgi:hypothetical protein